MFACFGIGIKFRTLKRMMFYFSLAKKPYFSVITGGFNFYRLIMVFDTSTAGFSDPGKYHLCPRYSLAKFICFFIILSVRTERKYDIQVCRL